MPVSFNPSKTKVFFSPIDNVVKKLTASQRGKPWNLAEAFSGHDTGKGKIIILIGTTSITNLITSSTFLTTSRSSRPVWSLNRETKYLTDQPREKKYRFTIKDRIFNCHRDNRESFRYTDAMLVEWKLKIIRISVTFSRIDEPFFASDVKLD